MKQKTKKKVNTMKTNRLSFFKKPIVMAAVLVFASVGVYLQTQSHAATSLAAGHIPGRILLGMAASESFSPKYAEALQITGKVFERRQFTPNWITTSNMNGMLDECQANNQYCVISFKV